MGISAPWPAIVRDGDIDALLDQAAAETDPSRQCELYVQFQQKYLGYAAAYPIWELNLPVAVRPNVVGLRFIPSKGSMPSFQELSLQSH